MTCRSLLHVGHYYYYYFLKDIILSIIKLFVTLQLDSLFPIYKAGGRALLFIVIIKINYFQSRLGL